MMRNFKIQMRYYDVVICVFTLKNNYVSGSFIKFN